MRKAVLARSGLLVAAVANLALAAMCVLGSGGQMRTVAVDVRGGEVQVRVDGFQAIPDPNVAPHQYTPVEIPESGTVALGVAPPVPSLPDPQGIDAVVVRGSDGAELFRDDFDSLDLDKWQIVAGDFEIDDGVLVARDRGAANQLELRGTGWRDYTLEVSFRNGGVEQLGVRRNGLGALYYDVQLIREYPSALIAYREDGAQTEALWVPSAIPGERGTVTSLLAMVAGSYPLPLLALAAGALAAAGLALLEQTLLRAIPGLARRSQKPAMPPWIRLAIWPTGVLAVALAALGVTVYIMWHYYDRLPHTPDEASFVFQAQLFAAGRLTTAIPGASEAFHILEPNWLYERGGRWSTMYPLGHSLALTPGVAAGAAWLMPPLLGGSSVALLGFIGRRLHGTMTGLLAALLLAASPFFLMQSSNFFAHITWVFYILMSMFLMLQRQKIWLFGTLAGFFFGLAVHTRLLEGVVLIPPFAFALAWPLVQQETRKEGVTRCLSFFVGGAVAAALMLISNLVITGSPLELAYAEWSEANHFNALGFQDGHTLSIGLRDMQVRLMALILVLNGWPAVVGLTFAALPFLLGSRNAWDYFCLACVVLLTAIYLTYPGVGLYEGPRYYFHAVPFLMLLSARGAVLAAGLIGAAATKLRMQLTHDLRTASWAGAAVVTPFLLFLIVDGTGGWLFGWNKDWLTAEVPEVQSNVNDLHDIWGLNNRLQELADEMGIKENALVLVRPCAYSFHSCYDTVFNENSVDFNGDIVWAHYVPELNESLIAAYPERKVYVANWDPVWIVPYEAEESAAGETQ
jgi:dolichyl-phosphate-mannose-protein mannosyltransferase